MMFKWSVWQGLCLLSLLLSPTLMAAEVEVAHHDVLKVDPGISLRQVLEQTVGRNPQRYRLQARGLETAARHAAADTLFPRSPALALSHQNDALGSGRGEREWQADVELPLWHSGQRAARAAVAENADNELQAGHERLLLEVAGQLREAVWDVKLMEGEWALAESRRQTAIALQRDVEQRLAAGELARTDLLLIRQETLQADAEAVRTEAELNHARHRYTLLTGLQRMPAQVEEVQSSRTDFDQTHALLHEAESQVKLAERERELTGLESREPLQLVVNARSLRGAFDNAYNDSVGLSLRIPLTTANQLAPQLAAADMRVAEAVTTRERLRYQLESAMHEADHQLLVTRAELEIAGSRQALASENLRLAEKAFKLGESDLVDLLRVRAQAYEAERTLQLQKLELQRDIARYNQAVGELP